MSAYQPLLGKDSYLVNTSTIELPYERLAFWGFNSQYQSEYTHICDEMHV
jgi:hypothetical protein